jgi:ABC-type antimicrobial peptide transport system permease subunit
VTAVGAAIGVACAIETTRLMGYLLYEVSPRDPSTFGAALAVVALAAFTACIGPARRATRTDLIQALRA